MFCSAVIGAFLGRTPAAVSSDPSGLPAKGRCLITPTLPSPCCRGTCPLGVKGRRRRSFLERAGVARPLPALSRVFSPPRRCRRNRVAVHAGRGWGWSRRAAPFCRDRMLGGADRLNPTEAAGAPGEFPRGFEQLVASEVWPVRRSDV